MIRVHLIMPMAGGGQRFSGFDVPKPMILLNDRPFFFWAVQSVCKYIDVEDITFVVLQKHVQDYGIDEEIRKYYPDSGIVVIPELLNGAVLTCKEAVKEIIDDKPILFNDCDHAFCSTKLYSFLREGTDDLDGALLTFKADSPNFSYVKYDGGGHVIGTVEKVVVSNDAICGAYYFKNKQVFISSSDEYLSNCEYSEFFMSGVYNELIEQGGKVATFPVDEHIPFGTPDEYAKAKDDDGFDKYI